ncbi:polysaccharide deacetylase family protein [Natrononativus amylolyticus]|uniref:polysaccharide deacetylase family protein n=1 Tax=Natrononativus amylolyticus TaxID=2963434 RepID=UPI0020CE53E6|nr:polysaccharide deacetylase family protein [Natrononativus amylolyticus]
MTRQNRRRFIASAGAAGIATGLAGCVDSLRDTGAGGDDDDGGANNTSTDGGNGGGDTDEADDPVEDDDEVGELISDFDEDFDSWYELDSYGDFGTETDEYKTGERALRMVAEEDDAYVGVQRSFSEPLDLEGKNLSLALKVNEPEFYRIEVRLHAPGSGNMLHLNRTHTGPSNHWMRVDLGATGETGSPDLSEVYDIQIIARRRDQDDPDLDFVVDELRAVDAPDTGVVMLTWDDNHESQWRAFEMMEEYGFPGTAGVIHHAVGAGDRLDTGQLREMQSAGWDIVSHPHPEGNWSTPFTEEDFDENEQRQMLEDSKRWLQQRGFEEGAEHYIAPGNVRDATNVELLREIHESSLSFGGGNTGIPMTDTHAMGRIDGHDVDLVKDYIDLAAKYKQACIPMWHVVGEEYDNAEVTEDEYEEILEHIDDADVEVVTQSQIASDDF